MLSLKYMEYTETIYARLAHGLFSQAPHTAEALYRNASSYEHMVAVYAYRLLFFHPHSDQSQTNKRDMGT